MGIYYADILDVLRAAGCKVAESATTDGWQHRARASGGFATAPLATVWHHTASTTSPANDLNYMINGSDDAPIGNLLLDRTGTYWPIAAGCANTQGKGGPVTLSRGTIPVDSGNSKAWAIEACNSGVGEVWPVEQIDAYFLGSNALSAHFGNLPTDVITHSLGAGGGWTDRKIDPAVAWEIEGSWQPSSVTTSGTWSLADIRDECARRADTQPEPIPPSGDENVICVFESQTNPRQFNAVFFGIGDAHGRTIELQWSGNGADPAVQERIATMLDNFGPARPLLLAGVKNNRLHPKHRPSDLIDSLHIWTDSDFAP